MRGEMQPRIAIVILALSAAGLTGIAVREGYSGNAYPDPVLGTAVPTIGFGTTGGVKMGDTTTPVKALVRAQADMRRFEGAVKGCVKVPLHQHEYDAYISLSYNIGASAFCQSALARHLNASQYQQACAAILDWKYVGQTDCSAPGNKSCSGLWKDRLLLNQQCLGQTP